jgi:CDGSH-type Zn-finger protein
MAIVELLIRRNGSTKVIGDVVLKDQDGTIITPPEKPFKLCRCGASKVKPFCDGTYRTIGWNDGSDQLGNGNGPV